MSEPNSFSIKVPDQAGRGLKHRSAVFGIDEFSRGHVGKIEFLRVDEMKENDIEIGAAKEIDGLPEGGARI